MPLTVVFPRDRAGDATYASLAAQVQAGMARVVQERRGCSERRSAQERRQRWDPLPVGAGGRRAHKQRGAQRRQAVPLPVGLKMVVTS